ncbi:DNA-processing protein DprA [Desulfovibrio sp. OttesenSCG-928-O18]|nr:DNA-processing protein DprA [Desulfovibrio sp. OttesenSCG-928-O18]
MMASGKPHPYTLTRRDDAAKQEYWSCLALRECSGIGMRRIAALLEHFGSAYEAVQNLGSWPDAGVSAQLAVEFRKEKWRQQAYLEWTAAKIGSCGILFWSDPEYPALLRTIPDPPPFLYFYGDLSLLKNPAVAVVGMRLCSDEGLKATIQITRGLARAGLTVVSGMAKGIDRAAHLAGLEGVGSSIGVLGAGIDSVYPPDNSDLYVLMHEKGLLVSELPPGFGVDGKCFPIRNRIISGLSRAVVVVEAAVRSGSLNTAKHALEQDRELMAVPGPATATSAKGCQELIRRGAKPVFQADDVLRELVPYLAESVGRDVVERDLMRFRKPSADKQGTEAAASPSNSAGDNAGAEAGLPWRVVDSGRKATKRKEAVQQRCEASQNATSLNGAAMGLAGLDAHIYDLVRKGPMHIDDICRSLGQNAQTVSSAATLLEVRGLLVRQPGMMYGVKLH